MISFNNQFNLNIIDEYVPNQQVKVIVGRQAFAGSLFQKFQESDGLTRERADYVLARNNALNTLNFFKGPIAEANEKQLPSRELLEKIKDDKTIGTVFHREINQALQRLDQLAQEKYVDQQSIKTTTKIDFKLITIRALDKFLELAGDSEAYGNARKNVIKANITKATAEQLPTREELKLLSSTLSSFDRSIYGEMIQLAFQRLDELSNQ